ncbi:MAG: SpaH/EbpB family LPXTG-anchored major pilin [Eubacterium sp.]|nr:SpaH/EbpB family LPXTG-anchored major pilin [Eubacterium sp.]
MVLTMNLSITAFAEADKGDTATISITETTDNHVYKIYQIFDGGVDADGNLTNISFGSGVDTTNLDPSDTTAAAVASALAKASAEANATLGTTTSTSVDSNYDGEEIVAWLKSEYGIDLASMPTATLDKDSSGFTTNATDPVTYTYKSGDLNVGYYVIIDSVTDATGTKDTTISSYFVRLLGEDLSLTLKKSVPEVTKEILDYNDSTGDVSDWDTSADYDIGDLVDFQITATLPENYSDYNAYYMLFTDTLSTGLAYDSTTADLVVKVVDSTGATVTTLSGSDPDPEYTVNATVNGDGTTTLTVKITDLKKVANAEQIGYTCKVVVTYKAKLDTDAVIGGSGNPNTVYLTYTNNPNTTGDGSTETTDTPPSTVVAFTYEFNVTKTDDNGNALKGADFTLFKKVSTAPTLTSAAYDTEFNGTYADDSAPSGANYYYVKVTESNETVYYYVDATNAGSEIYYKIVSTIATDNATGTEGNIYEFEGIDDGTYVLVETKVPDGYNQASDLVFTVNATHNETQILTLTTSNVTGGTIAVTDPATTGQLTTTVANKSGAVIPETGGMGTKIFYTLGGILVVCAGVLLIVKRRMRNA